LLCLNCRNAESWGEEMDTAENDKEKREDGEGVAEEEDVEPEMVDRPAENKGPNEDEVVEDEDECNV
jgi:hypothetical protein